MTAQSCLKKTSKTIDAFSESGVHMIKPLEALSLHCNKPLQLRDRKIWTKLLDAAWGEIGSDQWHEISTAELKFGSQRYLELLTPSLRRLKGAMIEIKKKINGKKDTLFVSILGDSHLFDRGVLKYRFSPAFIEIVYDSTRWVQVKKSVVFKMRSGYSIALYEWLESIARRNNFSKTVTVAELRKIIGVQDGKIDRMDHFRDQILIPAMDEINCLSNYIFTCAEGHKGGRQVKEFTFSWATKVDPAALNDADLVRTGAREYQPKGSAPKIQRAVRGHGVKAVKQKSNDGVQDEKYPNHTKIPDMWKEEPQSHHLPPTKSNGPAKSAKNKNLFAFKNRHKLKELLDNQEAQV